MAINFDGLPDQPKKTGALDFTQLPDQDPSLSEERRPLRPTYSPSEVSEGLKLSDKFNLPPEITIRNPNLVDESKQVEYEEKFSKAPRGVQTLLQSAEGGVAQNDIDNLTAFEQEYTSNPLAALADTSASILGGVMQFMGQGLEALGVPREIPVFNNSGDYRIDLYGAGQFLKDSPFNYKAAVTFDQALESPADLAVFGVEKTIESVPHMLAALYLAPAYIASLANTIGETRAQNEFQVENNEFNERVSRVQQQIDEAVKEAEAQSNSPEALKLALSEIEETYRQDILSLGEDIPEFREQNFTDSLKALPFAVGVMALERILPRAIAADRLALGSAALQSGVARVGAATATGITIEASTEAVQSGIIEYLGETVGTGIETSFDVGLRRAAEGALAGGFAGGTIGGAAQSYREFTEARSKTSQRRLDRLVKTIDTEFKKLTPDRAERFIDALDPQASQEVYFDEQQLTEYLAQVETDAPGVASLQRALEQSSQLGTVPSLPVSEFLTSVATDHYAAIRDFTSLEAELAGGLDAHMAIAEEEIARIQQEARERADLSEESNRIFTHLKDQLIATGVFSPGQSRELGEVMTQWAVAVSARRGIPLRQVYDTLLPDIQGPFATAPGVAHELRQDRRVADTPVENDRRANFNNLSADEQFRAVYTNELSGILNRRAFEEDVESSPVVVSIDVDSLKAVNDNLGHDTGDAMLRDVARVFHNATQGSAYHISGDEFYILGEDEATIRQQLAQAEQELAGLNLQSSTGQARGIRFTAGFGKNKADADHAMEQEKGAREARGERTPRGVLPAHIDLFNGSRSTVGADRRVESRQVEDDRRVSDRRSDVARRKLFDTLSAETRYALIYANPVSHLPNRRAFKEDLPSAKVVVSIDVDSLKAVNDNLGHDAGDNMLRTVGHALRQVLGDRAYHISGDEFYVLGEDEATIHQQLEQVSANLADAKLTSPHGSITGLGFTAGFGKDKADADHAMEQEKIAREARGERVGTGQLPTGLRLGPEVEQTGRGYYDPARNIIRFTQASDVSTALHEFAHAMYESELKQTGEFVDSINDWFLDHVDQIAAEAGEYSAEVQEAFEQMVFHGSIADFTEPDLERAGSSHGLAYGWGFYTSESLDEANDYLEMELGLSDDALYNGETQEDVYYRIAEEEITPDNLAQIVFFDLLVMKRVPLSTIDDYLYNEASFIKEEYGPYAAVAYSALPENIRQRRIDRLDHLVREWFVNHGPEFQTQSKEGSIKVFDLNEEVYANYNEPWENQPQYVKDRLPRFDFTFGDFYRAKTKEFREKRIAEGSKDTLEGIERAVDMRAASEWFAALGIPGNRHRWRNSASHFVTWDKNFITHVRNQYRESFEQRTFHGTNVDFATPAVTGELDAGFGYGFYTTDNRKIADFYGSKVKEVEIPEDSELLNLDATYEQQTDFIKSKLEPFAGTARDYQKRLTAELGSAKAASLFLMTQGVVGARYDALHDKPYNEEGTNYVLWDQRLFGEPDGQAQSQSQFSTAGGIDVSEVSESYEDLFRQGGINRGSATITPEAVRQYITEGSSGHFGQDAAIRRSLHENFARSFEEYFMEGEGPRHLDDTFASLSSQLATIYSTSQQLRSAINDEKAGQIFRSLLNAQEAIDENLSVAMPQPLVSSERAARSRKLSEKALARIHRRVSKRLTKQAESAFQEELAAEIVRITDELKANDPLYSTIEALKEGPIKIDRESIAEYDPHGLVRPALRGMTARNGIHISDVADMFGFDSTEVFIDQVTNSPSVEVAAEMKARERLEPQEQALSEQVEQALRNEERVIQAIDDLRSLGGEVNRKELRRQAKEYVGKLRVKDMLISKFHKAELDAARAAASETDRDLKRTHKIQQILANYVVMEAMAAKKKSEKIVRELKSFDSAPARKTLKLARGEFFDRMQTLLARHGLTQRPVVELARSARDWAASLQAEEGLQIVLSDALLNGVTRPHSDLTYRELQGLHATATNLMHVAKLTRKVTVAGEKQELKRVVSEWTGEMNSTIINAEVVQRTATEEKRGVGHWFKEWLPAWQSKVGWVARWLDGGHNVGLSYQLLVDPLQVASQRAGELVQSTLNPIVEAYDAIPRERLAYLDSKHYFADLAQGRHDGNLYGRQILMVALTVGNRSGLRKLLLGEGWAKNESEVSYDNPILQRILSTMTDAEWNFVETVWKQLETLREPLFKVARENTGVEPEAVESASFNVNGRKVTGGYFPVAYDLPRSHEAAIIQGQQNTESLFGERGFGTSVSAGSLINRSGFFGPIDLNVNTIVSHVRDTTHYITHYEPIRGLNKLLNNKDVRESIVSKLGIEEYNGLKQWLKDVAHNGNATGQKSNPLDAVFRHFRIGSSLITLGYRLSTTLIQPVGLANTLAEIGPKYMRIGLVQAKYFQAQEFIHSRSRIMAQRAETLDREIHQRVEELRRKGLLAKWHIKAKKWAWVPIAFMQRTVDQISWMGAYHKQLEIDGDERKAIQYADWVIDNIQGSALSHNLPRMLRDDSETLRLFTMFMTAMNAIHNQTRDLYRTTAGKQRRDISPLALTGSAASIMVLPVIYEAILRGDTDDEDAPKLLARMITTPFSTIPLVRDVVNTASRNLTGDVGRFRAAPALDNMANIIKATDAAFDLLLEGEEPTRADYKAAAKAAGTLLHIPGVNQLLATGEGIEQALNEFDDNLLRDLYNLSRKGTVGPDYKR